MKTKTKVRRRHFPSSPTGEDGVKRRRSPDLGARDGGRARGAGFRPDKRGAKARSGASAWNPSHRERREEGEKVTDDRSAATDISQPFGWAGWCWAVERLG